jgi:hypothetical protein
MVPHVGECQCVRSWAPNEWPDDVCHSSCARRMLGCGPLQQRCQDESALAHVKPRESLAVRSHTQRLYEGASMPARGHMLAPITGLAGDSWGGARWLLGWLWGFDPGGIGFPFPFLLFSFYSLFILQFFDFLFNTQIQKWVLRSKIPIWFEMQQLDSTWSNIYIYIYIYIYILLYSFIYANVSPHTFKKRSLWKGS